MNISEPQPFYMYESSEKDKISISVRSSGEVSESNYRSYLDGMLGKHKTLLCDKNNIETLYDGSRCCIFTLKAMISDPLY